MATLHEEHAAAQGAPGQPEKIRVQCCVVGGGPAGMMLGFLLARAGVSVAVLEKHGDFLRDFRGDTIHPSTLDVMHELGFLDEFLKLPHEEVTELGGRVGNTQVMIADFRHVPTHCRFIAFMPQWDFLNFLAEKARSLPGFQLRMKAEVKDIVEEGGRVVGVRAETPTGLLEVRADLVVGCDGRHSTVRERAGFHVDDLGAPMDILWMRLSRKTDDPPQTLGYFNRGHILVMLNRGDSWQCGFVIPKGHADEMRKQPIEAFRNEIVEMAPFTRDRVTELNNWDAIKLLSVSVDRLRTWHRPGLLCIGDAAHTMSPIGGVGINLAIQDAVATANLLAVPLRSGTLTEQDLKRVQRRREFPTRFTQRLQVLIQNRIIGKVLASSDQLAPPWPLRLFNRFPLLRRIPARIIGVGVRPEHVRVAAATPSSAVSQRA
ncbi:MAG TPA: FAD-dependent oxidoreductase [Planctomycetaceae bacterium]|nr:FAD-dependent oxidoreductase [Planctomycetaceae bacterium]